MKYCPKDIKIGNKIIGIKRPCFIIAEAGANHNQNLSLAKELICIASESGADAVKFQTIKFDELYVNELTDKKTRDFIKSIELHEKWHYELKRQTELKKMVFLSTPTYFSAVEFLRNLGVRALKIASAQIASDLRLIDAAAKTGLPLFISTGLVNSQRISKVVDICKRLDNEKIVLLHCVSLYPTPPGKMSLTRMTKLKRQFGTLVGFSDHSLGRHFSVAAAALGAKVIEKHITLNKKMNGPDHFFSLEPDEFKKMVLEIRQIESGMVPNDRAYPDEIIARNNVQLKWVTGRSFSAGEKFAESGLLSRRLKNGISVDKPLTGFYCAVDIEKGEVVTKKSIRKIGW